MICTNILPYLVFWITNMSWITNIFFCYHIYYLIPKKKSNLQSKFNFLTWCTFFFRIPTTYHRQSTTYIVTINSMQKRGGISYQIDFLGTLSIDGCMMGSGSHTLFPGFSVGRKRLWRCHSRLTELEVRLLVIFIGLIKLHKSIYGGPFFQSSLF